MRLGDLLDEGVTASTSYADLRIAGLTSDSRKVAPGFLFAAIAGSSADGLAFVGDALEQGAAAVLIAAKAKVGDVPPDVAVLRADDPRLALSQLAARFHPRQPRDLVAVTGTSGKTSVADFVRQIFISDGRAAASIGTLGLVDDSGVRIGALTTPDPVELHADLDRLATAGVDSVAVEASSHGLDQRRLHGLRLRAAAFTNLGRDHLDYHADMADYLAAKLKLFTEVLPALGTAVVDMDDRHSDEVATATTARGQTLLTTGRKGRDLRLVSNAPDGPVQRAEIEAFGRVMTLTLAMAGSFQVSNALVAVALAVAVGVDPDAALEAVNHLKGVPGRLEFIGRRANGAMAFVDYAHKPDALRLVLAALRPMASGRLVVVIGAGGDRDPGKRPLMGQEASRAADVVIVTDDNPRSEDPTVIRRAILDGAPRAMEIGDRASAVAQAVHMLEAGDVLCVAGKGHETGQIVGDETLPFSDHEVLRAALEDLAA